MNVDDKDRPLGLYEQSEAINYRSMKMSEPLIGKVLEEQCCDDQMVGWAGCSRFCFVLEETEQTLIAVELAVDFEDCGSYGLERPRPLPVEDNVTKSRYVTMGEPFELRKVLQTAESSAPMDKKIVAYRQDKHGKWLAQHLWVDGCLNKCYFVGW